MDEKDWAEERVMQFTAQHWRIRKSRSLTTDSRLAQDLGMDGSVHAIETTTPGEAM